MSARVVVLLWLSLFCLLGDSVVLHNSALLAKTRSPNAAPTVVLLHGLLGSSRNFGAFARILYEKLGSEHNIVAIDARNHGRSVALGPMPIAYELMSEDVTDTLNFLNIEKAHVIGHSMGGKIAATLALSSPDRVQSLAILDISPVQYTEKELSSVTNTVYFLQQSQSKLRYAKSKEEVTEIFSELTKDAALQAFLNSNLQPIDGNNEIGGYRWKYHVDAMVEGIVNILSFSSEDMLYHGPTVVLKAGKSDFVRTKHVDTIKTLFPNYRLVTVRDSGHWLHAEKPEETASMLHQFIEFADASSSSF